MTEPDKKLNQQTHKQTNTHEGDDGEEPQEDKHDRPRLLHRYPQEYLTEVVAREVPTAAHRHDDHDRC